MPIRFPTICDYRQMRSPLEKGLLAGIISHGLSFRCDELCLFEALHPAPLARPFSKGLLVRDYLTWAFIPLQRIVPLRGTLSCAFGAALLQGPTRGDYLTWAFMPLRRIVPLRGTPSCAFGAALLQGPTRGDYLTWAFMPLRRIVPLRGTPSCAFGAALLQGPTRGDYLTWAFMPLRRIVPLRGTPSCAFGAALLQGPTRGRNILVPSHSFFISFSDGVK